MVNEFDLERAKAGEPIIYQAYEKWVKAKFHGSSAAGHYLVIEHSVGEGMWKLGYASKHELRMAPKKVKGRYRVAVMKHGHGGFYTINANNDDEAEAIRGWTNFVRWLTDWIEIEVTE